MKEKICNRLRIQGISTAVILAAGKGSRLRPVTNHQPKCLTEINGVPILKRLVHSLRQHGFTRLVVVVGYLDHCVREALAKWKGDLSVEYILNHEYATTNNIYSLWLARNLIREPFLLIECDILFDGSMLEHMCKPDRIAVSSIRPWMSGSTVNLDHAGRVIDFQVGAKAGLPPLDYKTVNMYSLSMQSWRKIVRQLGAHISAGGVHDYYEELFGKMVAEKNLSFQGVLFDPNSWYEVDTLSDLCEAERVISQQSA